MSAEKIAHRYSAALLSLSQGQAELQDKIISDLQSITELFENKPVRKVIASPIVSADLLTQIFSNITTQLQSSDLFKKFIGILIEAKRTSLIPELARTFRHEVQKSRGIVDATVTAAVALRESEVNDIRTKLEGLLGKRVNLLQHVDSSILGGFAIRIDNSVLDMTLKTKLEHMTKFAVS